MNFYEHHIGDYLKDTAHLSLLEHGVYKRLLDVYYTRESAIPEGQAARLVGARSAEEIEALNGVLNEFFTLKDGFWTQDRCEVEIARYRSKSAKAKASAEARWGVRQTEKDAGKDADANAMRTHSDGIAKAMLPVTSNHKEKETHEPGGSALSLVAVEPDKPKRKGRAKKPETKLGEYLQALPEGEAAIREDDSIFEWAADAKIPADWIAVAWFAFKAKMLPSDKLQADWPATFRNYVRLDYLKLWAANRDGDWFLTPAGEAARRAMQAQAQREAA